MIPVLLLTDAGATSRWFSRGERLFTEGDHAKYYFQIVSGTVKMNNFNDEGKEFLQGMFTAGDSFGEPPLLISTPYPANAEAITEVEVLTLGKDAFFTLLNQNPEASIALSKRLAERLYYKAVMASEISSQHPEHRLLTLIDYLKIHVAQKSASDRYGVELTRQQLADLTGLRVETVIRSVKALEKKGELTILSRKIYR